MADVLEGALEVSEVAFMWARSTEAVRVACEDGRLRWRFTRSGRRLVDRVSALALWGDPSGITEISIYEVIRVTKKR